MPRSHTAEIELPVPPTDAFEALITPSSICAWWSASHAIVIPEQDGMWMAVWGDDPDNPEYISGATITGYDPPRRLTLGNTKYVAHTGPLPFDADLPFEFIIEPEDSGCVLRVTQTGFPDEPVADEHFQGCVTGWANTLESLKNFLSSRT